LHKTVKKVAEDHPHVIDHIKNRDIQLVINIPAGKEGAGGSHNIRRTVLRYGFSYATALSGAGAMASGVKALIKRSLTVRSLQEYHNDIGSRHNSPMPQEFGNP
jgi:carbamoyl-phosphate synthase large subunit